jgi:hypothetical protein
MSPQERKRYLSLAERRARPGSGSAAGKPRRQPAAFAPPQVHALLGDVPFAVVGGLATRRYMPERMTLDVDVLVAPADLSAAERHLRQAGCRKKGRLTIGRSTWATPAGQTLDLIALHEPWVEEAIATAVPAPDRHPYVSLPFLVLMKMSSSRVQDLADISRMLAAAKSETLTRTRVLLKRFRPSDLEDLEAVIRLGKLETRGGRS